MTNRTDNFNRVDNSSSLGTPSDGGGGWDASANGGATWGITGNKAYENGDQIQAIATLESSVTDVDVQVTISGLVGGTNDLGIVLRRTAGTRNYLCAKFNQTSDTFRFFKCVGGSPDSFTQIGSTVVGTVSNGDVFRARAQGTSLYLYQNGTLVHSVTGVTDYSTQTSHGIQASQTTEARFEDFSIAEVTSGGGSSIAAISNYYRMMRS